MFVVRDHGAVAARTCDADPAAMEDDRRAQYLFTSYQRRRVECSGDFDDVPIAHRLRPTAARSMKVGWTGRARAWMTEPIAQRPPQLLIERAHYDMAI